jgi:hypothetical protein
MRHGWKTRMDERRYFELKKQEREEKQAIMEFMKMKMEQQWEMANRQVVINEKEVH